MRAVGLITEYNPFHNGHLHHLRESLKAASADVAVAVMSGHFLQRGEPALVDKWARAEMALAAGVDLVMELPLPWACSSAPDFARGGVQALSLLGGVEALCFGSESGDIGPLKRCAELLGRQEKRIAEQAARLLRQGVNYPQARARVLHDLLPESLSAEDLAAPNNVLGIEYLKALQQTGSSLLPLTVERIGAGYHDTAIGPGQIASATGVRKRLLGAEPVESLMPPESFPLLQEVLQRGRFFSAEHYLRLLQAQIFRDADRLDHFWLVEDGLERRLIHNADKAPDLEGFVSLVKSRQLTRTRIQRSLVAVLLGWPKGTIRSLLAGPPRYLHLLGMNCKGRDFLSASRKQRQGPLVQNFSRIFAQLKRYYGEGSAVYRQALEQLALEQRATRIYTLLQHHSGSGPRNRDFYEPVIHHRDGQESKIQ